MKGLFQGKPVQPEGDLWDHTMLVLVALAGRPDVHARLCRVPARRGQALDPAVPARPIHVPQPRTGGRGDRRAGRPAAQALQLRAGADHLAGRGFTSISARPSGCARRSSSDILAEPGIEELLALHRADALASTGDAQHVDYCWYYLEHQPSGPINPPPLLTGHDLVRHGLKPGPRFAVLLDRVREAQLDGQVQSKREALEWVDRLLEGEGGPAGDRREPDGPPTSDGCRSSDTGLE